MIFNIFINGPAFIFLALCLYVNIFMAKKSRYGGFEHNEKRVSRLLIVHRVYVILWTFFHLANVGFGFTEDKRFLNWHALFVAM